jgi:hypothetical protein
MAIRNHTCQQLAIEKSPGNRQLQVRKNVGPVAPDE